MSVSGEWLENGAGEDGFGAKFRKGSKKYLHSHITDNYLIEPMKL